MFAGEYPSNGNRIHHSSKKTARGLGPNDCAVILQCNREGFWRFVALLGQDLQGLGHRL
jgi:ribosomal protein L28